MLTGAETYTGSTSVTSGTLVLGGGGSLAGTSVTVGGGGNAALSVQGNYAIGGNG